MLFVPSKMEENFEISATSDSPSKILSSLNFPSDVYKWMKINAKPKMALKLMKVCKYFQHSDGFPYLVVKQVSGASSLWGCFRWLLITLEKKVIAIKNLQNITEKLWIIGNTEIYGGDKDFSTLLSKNIVCNIQKIKLFDQQMTLNEFKFLTDGGMVEECVMIKTKIIYENDEIVSIEDIFECLSNAREIHIRSKAPSFFSLKNAETKISSKLEKLILYIPPTIFDIHNLFTYMKSHQKVQYTLWLCGISTEEFTKNIIPSVNNMIQEWPSEYKKPVVLRY